MPLLGGALFRNASAGGGGGGGTDPYFANVVLLLGFEGTDGATTTTDESPSPHSMTFNGNAQIDTAQAKFGSSSCLFDGTGDYVSTPDSADWRLSAANSDLFTVELWMRPHGAGDNWGVVGQVLAGDFGNWSWYINYNFQRIFFSFTPDGGSFTTTGTGSDPQMTIDAWHYIAVSKNASGKIRIWVDGTLTASSTPANSSFFNSTRVLALGRSTGGDIYDGHLDEIRITKGVCRYDTDGSITVPTAAFPRS